MTRAAAAVPHVDSARTEAQNVSVAGAARIERPRPVFTVRANEGEVSIPESAGGGKEDCIALFVAQELIKTVKLKCCGI